MAKKPKQTLTQQELCDLFDEAHVFYVATVDKHGDPKVRPFGAHLMIDGKLYFTTFSLINAELHRSQVYKQMKHHKRIEICGYWDKGDSATDEMGTKNREWFRVSGKVKFINDPKLAPYLMGGAPAVARKYMALPGVGRGITMFIKPFVLEDVEIKKCWFFRRPEVYGLSED